MLRTVSFLAALIILPACASAQTPAPSLTPQPARRPAPCATPEFRAFDYWIGEWTVSDTTGQVMATSSITKVSGDCAIAEHWQPIGGKEGRSLSWYEPKDQQWHQQWVDGDGWTARFDGNPDAGEMVLTEMAHPATPNAPIGRMRYITRPGGVVRQSLWQSKDQGETWMLMFVGDYSPKR